MRRPLPPELIALGDHLERAAARALARRRTRRQVTLNSATSFIVALPVAVLLATTQLSATVTSTTDTAPRAAAIKAARFAKSTGDVLPRDMRRAKEAPSSELLIAPSSLRRALR